ncbi:PLP-dependent aminotransferase family protein [Cohnella terricola]|uniref:PLP-dependent aminotransferase family protein n=1 Tax=Cohnella terricola TaxID=1289167 RepID=A0A559JIN5_9BACL|nr:PLP-dependent aminotransferase family protein [Cohnella terricola]TVX99737.1 PLP-dependent aminotransferase family protein [Cohnella terricola]
MSGLSPLLDRESGIPVYLQLYAYIRQQIESGKLAFDDKLPSIRELSSYLHVSKNTVEIAYQQLVAEGYVHSKPRSGLRVLRVEPVMGEKSGVPVRGPSATAPKMTSGKNAAEIDFRYGDVALEKFPLAVWKKCMSDALGGDLRQILGYGDLQGNPELRYEIARYLYASRGIYCSPEQIFLAGGTQQAIGLLCQLLPLAKRVAIEDPGYDGVRTVLVNHDRDIIPIPIEADGLNVEAVQRSGAGAVYLTPSHQFPIGGILPVHKRARLLQWAADEDAMILEDDYDSEFRYQGQPIPALKAMDSRDRVVYLGTFSKSFLPAMRLGYFVLPERLAGDFLTRLEPYSQSVSPLLQQAMLMFMKEGHFERHVRKMRKLYQGRHRALLNAVHRHLGSRVGIIGHKAGLHLLLDIHGRDSSELIALAARRGVNVYSPRSYWCEPESCPRSFVMLGFGGLSEGAIEEGILRLRQSWFGHESAT